MMLNIERLRKQIADAYPDMEQIEPNIIRFTKEGAGQPYAVCYVDLAAELPETPDALTAYQDRVIGKRYFDGRKSLQWSNYLYFVVSDDRTKNEAFRKAKALVEVDRVYARKFVVTGDELSDALVFPADETSRTPPRANILSAWLDKLADAGLDSAVVSDRPLPGRLALIEATPSQGTKPPTAQVTRKPTQLLPFLSSVEMKKYREFPVQRQFEFGTVNLIVGPNGSGKTSLLEAIELVYCGKNKRCPDADDAYNIAVVYADGAKENATHSRIQRTFREWNLTWYGQSEIKTNNLCFSFGLFNFLDTDAAVGMADSAARLDDNLSNLLVGAEASRTWKEIERVHGATTARLRELRPVETQIKSEMTVIDARLKESRSIKRESDSILDRLEDMLRRLKWRVPVKDKGAFVEGLLEDLSELDSLAEQAAAFEWAESPTTMQRLTKYCNEVVKNCQKTASDITSLENLQKNERQSLEAGRRCKNAIALVNEVTRIIAAGLPTRVQEFRKHQETKTSYEALFAGYEKEFLESLAACEPSVAVGVHATEGKRVRIKAQKALVAAQAAYEEFTKLRSQSVALAQQLRQIASQILKDSNERDKCPLCHTQFAQGQLSQHITLGLDEHVEVRGQELLSQAREREKTLRDTVAGENALNWLVKFCKRAKLPESVSIRAALTKLEETRQPGDEAQHQLEVLGKELESLESQGLSVRILERLPTGLEEFGFSLPGWSKEHVDKLQSTIEREQGIAAKALEDTRAEVKKLQQVIEVSLNLSESDVAKMKSALSLLVERQTVAESLRDKLAGPLDLFPWPREKPFSELLVEINSVRRVAADFQTAAGCERQAKSFLAESTKRRGQLSKQAADLKARIERFAKADKVLRSIKLEHSLTGAMESVLKQNRKRIETIFTRIHAPAEFSGLGESLTTLVRKNGEATASLNQISTGQRAAFALSIFLAQNAQLRAGPPIILIDDPIAHVDDLNSLSFLDFLRELALVGKRQIFFATASEKLATLFERKFDFFGPTQFRRYDLRR